MAGSRLLATVVACMVLAAAPALGFLSSPLSLQTSSRGRLSASSMIKSKRADSAASTTTITTMQAAGSGGISRRQLGQLGLGVAAVVGSRKLVAGGVYDDIPDLSGKTAVITGGNTGIGKETAFRLAQMGADVVIACRSLKRGEDAAKEIDERVAAASQAGGKKGTVKAMLLDLSSLKSVEVMMMRPKP
jgi:FlaA1/EpsC-like NDP-sugar epimerase